MILVYNIRELVGLYCGDLLWQSYGGVTPGRQYWGLCLNDGEPYDIESGTEQGI